MTKMTLSSRNHNVTLAVACIITCVVMLLFLLQKTHEKLEDSRGGYFSLQDKYTTLVKQFESLYEYKERLEGSFVLLKTKTSPMTLEFDSLKSELSVLKSSHKNEIQRLHDELDACRRREEVAIVHRSQKDEALSPSSLSAQVPSVPIPPVSEFQEGDKGHNMGLKFINNHGSVHQGNSIQTDKGPLPGPAQPSMDPNQDPAGNIFV